MTNRQITLKRLIREVKAAKEAVNPKPQLYADGNGELCSTAHPAEYSWAGTTLVWGQVA
jgi:hypothetical protein